MTGGASPVILTRDARPFMAAVYRADSASVPIFLARVRLQGQAGDSVAVTSNHNESLPDDVGSEVAFIASTRFGSDTVSLPALAAGRVVFRFAAAETPSPSPTNCCGAPCPSRVDGHS